MEGTRKTDAELVLLAVILLTGLILAEPAMLLLALPIAVHTTLGLLLSTETRDLRVRRSLSSHRIQEGDTVEAQLVVEKSGEGPDLVLVTEDTTVAEHVSEGRSNLVERVPSYGSLVLSYVTAPPRGFYPLESAHVSVRDLLGFTTYEGNLPCPTPLWVLPRYEAIGRVELLPRRTLSSPGSARSRRGGTGTQFFATRPYVPGDDPRRLNWKALARRHQMIVNLYEEERAAEVTIVTDGRSTVYEGVGGQELFNQAVRASAALCDSAIRDGHQTGLLLYGERLEWVYAWGGRVQRERILQGLAKAKLGLSEAFSDLGNLPTRVFPSGSSIIVVSPLSPGDEQALGMLRARGYDVLALVLTPSFVEKLSGPSVELASRMLALEREVMLQALMSAGVRVAVWNVNTPLASLVKTAWQRRR